MNNTSNVILARYVNHFRTIEYYSAEIKSKFGLCKYKQDTYYANTVKMCAMQTRIMQMPSAEHLFPLSYGARAFYASLHITSCNIARRLFTARYDELNCNGRSRVH